MSDGLRRRVGHTICVGHPGRQVYLVTSPSWSQPPLASAEMQVSSGATVAAHTPGVDEQAHISPAHAFLLYPEAWLERVSAELQAVARAEAADGGLLPAVDVQARLAAEPSDALANHVWLQEHRAASAGRGLGAGNGPKQQITLTTLNRVVVQCPQCSGLVSLVGMRHEARRSGLHEPHAACRSRQCLAGRARYRHAEYIPTQRDSVAGIRRGTRLLVRAPAVATARVATVVARADALNAADAAAAAAATLTTTATLATAAVPAAAALTTATSPPSSSSPPSPLPPLPLLPPPL